MTYQLDLFRELNEVTILEEKISKLENNNEKLRKALFARHGELAKKYIDMNDRLNVLEWNICKNEHQFKTQ